MLLKKHNAQVPYTQFESAPGVGILEIKALGLSPEAQLCLRSWCRLRCGILVLRHLSGRVSCARHQECIFCGLAVRNATVHTVGVCERWKDLRRVFLSEGGLSQALSSQDMTLNFLSVDVRPGALEKAIIWAAQIDRCAYDFWKPRNSSLALTLRYDRLRWQSGVGTV